jgi:[ribosomal protein S5]-alanine N-acetyltransferase
MIFSSGRLNYTRLGTADLENYMSLVTNQDVMKYITYFALTPENGKLRFEKAVEINEKYPEIGYYSVRMKEGDGFIGLVKLIHLADDQAEIGYMLLPAYWGKQFATEMVTHFVAYARKVKGIGELIAVVDPENAASIKVLKKCSFYLFKSDLIDNLPADYYMLDILKT